MTQSFDEWKEEQQRIHNDYDAENAWYAGAQSRQAEIDELRKRIDRALRLISKDIREFGSSNYLDNAVNVLKGTTNEQ